MQLGLALSRRLALVAAALAAVASHASAVVTVTNTTNAQALADAFAGGGVTVVGTPTLQGVAAQQGTFASTNLSTVGFASGVVLTTGSTADVPGPNSSGSTSVIIPGVQGDAQLAALAVDSTGATAPLDDTNALTFDFTVPAGATQVQFNFVFASEEYNEFTGSNFNDVLAVFVDGTNVALAPGSGATVSVNTINGGDVGEPAVNPQFYINNTTANPPAGTPSDPLRISELEADGLTTVLSAAPIAVLNPNLSVHTVKIAIGDVTDQSWDSQLFLRADSFVVPEPGVALFGLAAAAGLLLRKRK